MSDPLHTCRSCSGGGLSPLLDLGPMPLANGLLNEADLAAPEARHPLDIVHCPSCSLVQISHTMSPEHLFSDYPYFSSYSDTMLAHAQELADEIIGERGLGQESLVVELASNDGYLLQYYMQKDILVLGIEPAANVARVAVQQRGIETRIEFFGAEYARQLKDEGLQADVIHAHNVLAHVPDINGFVSGIATLLASNGMALIEVPYIRPMLENGEFDTIYHEHIFYFSLHALRDLLGRHGLVVEKVREIPLHGGSLQLQIGHKEACAESGSVLEMLKAESKWAPLIDSEIYLDFQRRVESLKVKLPAMLADLRSKGKRIAAYGAAAKGAILLNALKVGPDLIDYVVDRSPHKQGLFMPGVQIPIYSPEHLLEDRPDYVLLLAWNFAGEIMSQQEEYINGGGQFIRPLPEPGVIGDE